MSILGFVSRRPLVSLCAIAGLWWLWPSSPEPPAAQRAQAAVLADGFAASDGADRIVELDENAQRRRELRVASAASGGRVVGLADNIGIVWRDGKRVAVAMIESDGELSETTRFGKRAVAMCDGVATNDHQFGVAWLEADGGVWFVHGPTAAGSASSPISAVTAEAAGEEVDAPKPELCAIASAGDKIALLWTQGSRVSLALCGQRCGASRRVELPKKSTPIAFGCTGGGCTVVARSSSGSLEATWVNPLGKAQWTKPLPHAEPDSRVSLAGTGSQVAIAYATSNEPVVVAASKAGSISTVWQGAGDSVPSIVYSRGALLVARPVDGALTAHLVRVP